MSRSRRPSAATGLSILALLASHPKGLGVSDIGRALELDVGYAHRLLSALVKEGWISQVDDSKAYRATSRILSVAGELLRGLDVRGVAAPVMAELRDETGETAFLLESRGDSLVCIERRLSDEPVIVVTRIGDVVPLHGSAAGAALRAALALRAKEQGTAVDGQISGEIATILRRGYSIDDRSYPGVTGVASAIWSLEDSPVGVVAIVAPANRTPPERVAQLGERVKVAAQEISHSLGYRGRSWTG